MESGALAEFRRGWRVLLASSIGNGSGVSGIPFYTFGVFVLPLATAFGWSRGRVSIAASFLILGTAITAPIIGSIIDRFGTRRVGLWSLFALSCGYGLLTQLGGRIGFFYLAWLSMALVGGGTTPVVWTRAVNLWFDRGRGLALGLALAGSGLAGVFAPLLTTQAITAFGWQGGYLAIGAFIVVVSIPVIAVFFREEMPQRPRAHAAGGAAPELPGLTLRQSVRTVAYWQIALGFFLVSSVIAALIINLVPLLIDRGLRASDAARVAGVMGIAVLAGRVGTGFLIDRFRAPRVARLLLALSATGCVLLSMAGTPAWVVQISVISLGLAAAAEVDLVAFLTSRFLGLKAYGKVYGTQLTAFYLGASSGPFAAGLAYDHFHSYVPTLYVAAGALLLGAIVIGALGQPPEFE